jgi:hypothetical protein
MIPCSTEVLDQIPLAIPPVALGAQTEHSFSFRVPVFCLPYGLLCCSAYHDKFLCQAGASLLLALRSLVQVNSLFLF